MNLQEFCNEMVKRDIKIKVDLDKLNKPSVGLLNNDALFQLPLISMIVLLLAKDRRKPKVSELGQLVGECIEHTMIGYKKSGQHVGWSANMRVRTVEALTFLEYADLAYVDNRKSRVKITELGKKVIGHALTNDNDLSWNLSEISRTYRNICVSRKLDDELL